MVILLICQTNSADFRDATRESNVCVFRCGSVRFISYLVRYKLWVCLIHQLVSQIQIVGLLDTLFSQLDLLDSDCVSVRLISQLDLLDSNFGSVRFISQLDLLDSNSGAVGFISQLDSNCGSVIFISQLVRFDRFELWVCLIYQLVSEICQIQIIGLLDSLVSYFSQI